MKETDTLQCVPYYWVYRGACIWIMLTISKEAWLAPVEVVKHVKAIS